MPRKNIYPFFGRPLLAYTIKACQASKFVNRGIYVTTDDAEIAAVARRLGANVIDRPSHLADDLVWTQDVLKHAVEYLEGKGIAFDVVARLHASPQIEAEKIDEAVAKLQRNSLWEVFSVNQKGLEDAVIHILRKQCIWQQALSVYQGIVTTNYVDVHTKGDLDALEKLRVDEIEQESLKFLAQLQKQYNHASLWNEARYILGRPRRLWVWQMKVLLWQRWQAIKTASPELRELLYAARAFEVNKSNRVLDLGCGFGMYWPILREFGFRTFVGVDLFDLRLREAYYAAAKEYIAHFCGDCRTQLIMDDARNLSAHNLIADTFDVVLAVATESTKLRSTGIPRSTVDEIRRRYGSPQCIPVFTDGTIAPSAA